MLVKFARNVLIQGEFVGQGEIIDLPDKMAKEAVAMRRAAVIKPEDAEKLKREIKKDSEKALIGAPEKGEKGGGKK